jgi:uncharacterized protein YcbX
MPHVVALYRYPVKGFTPEGCDILTVLDEGRIEDDRVLGLRFADVVERVDEHRGQDGWHDRTPQEADGRVMRRRMLGRTGRSSAAC